MVGSTQDEARRIWKEKTLSDCDLLVVHAQGQTQGRGRQGRSWSSQSSENLYLSLAFSSSLIPKDLWTLWPLFFAEQIWSELGIEDLKVKWPNDLVFVERQKFYKCGGVLVESHGGAFFCGLGLNWVHAEFPSSRALYTKSERRKEDFVGRLVERLRGQFLKPQFATELSQCPQRLWNGPMAWIENRVLDDSVSRVKGLGPHGELLVERDGQIRSVVSGELRLTNL